MFLQTPLAFQHKNSRQHRRSGEHDNRTTDSDVNLFLLLLLQLHVAVESFPFHLFRLCSVRSIN